MNTTNQSRRKLLALVIVLLSVATISVLVVSISQSWSYAQAQSAATPTGAQQNTQTPSTTTSTSTTSVSTSTLPLVTEFPWGQILSMMAVLGVVSSAVQWLLTKTIIQPQITTAVSTGISDVRVWAITQFPSKSDFDIHALKDNQAHDGLTQRFNDLAHDLSQTAERAAIMHDKIIVLETAAKK